MIDAECMALLTYTNQIDPRVQLNEPTFDAWWLALERSVFDQAKWCVKLYYATTNPNNGPIPPLTPGVLRARISSERDRANAKQAAVTAGPVMRHPNSFRASDPARWDALVAEGAAKHNAILQARGLAKNN